MHHDSWLDMQAAARHREELRNATVTMIVSRFVVFVFVAALCVGGWWLLVRFGGKVASMVNVLP
jgi:hypothetical protein